MSLPKSKIVSPVAFGWVREQGDAICVRQGCAEEGSYLVAYYDEDENPRVRIVMRESGLLQYAPMPDTLAITSSEYYESFEFGQAGWRMGQDGRVWYATREIVMLLDGDELAQRYRDTRGQEIYVSASRLVYDGVGNVISEETSYFFGSVCSAYPVKITRLFDGSTSPVAFRASLEEVMRTGDVDGLAIAMKRRLIHYVDFRQAEGRQSKQGDYDRPLANLDV